MSDLMVFGGRSISVIDIVKEVSISVFWSLEDSVFGMGVIGSSQLHGMDGRIGKRTFTATTGGV